MKFKIFISASLFSVLILGSSTSFAAPQWCRGTINQELLDVGGDLYILPSWRNEWTQLCNMNGKFKDVPAAICKLWYSSVQAAVISGKSATVQYNDAPTCDKIGAYNAAEKPNYFLLMI